MKFCPTCQTRYDEEILRFCTKDGTPLVEENQPNFTTLPSESAKDDADEETVIRRNPPKSNAFESNENSQRIVVPMTQRPIEPAVRAKTTVSARQPPPKSNTGKIVLLTVLGTLIVLMGGGIIYLFLSRENAVDSNQNKIINANFNAIDMNLNANLTGGNSANFNFNANANSNLNTNFNTNAKANGSVKTPTPTPKTVTPTPTATPNANASSNVSNSNLSNTRLNATPTPAATPRTAPTPAPTDRPVNAGFLNGRAVNLPKPAYPPIAKQMRASGQVAVQVFVDENGNVLSAKATTGNTLLRAPAEAAARQSKFNPILVGNQAVKATGIVLYNFINQ